MENFNILVICGPTASGKTSLAVDLALKYNGEIISGDSRQVFRGMDIGTGKDLNEYKTGSGEVKHHLIDIADPMEEYNLYRYIKDFNKAFDSITSRGKLPILAGGSGLYIEGALKDYSLYPAPEDPGLRNELNDKSKDELMEILRAESGEILKRTDTSSTRRIIRGIEIARYIRNNPSETAESSRNRLHPLIIGVTLPREELIKRIDTRLDDRLKSGMVDEVKNLLEKGVTAERLIRLGLEYRYCTMYLQNEISYDDMTEKLKIEIHKFSKRQMTWLRGMERRGLAIHWIKGDDMTEAISALIRL
ncbi:MAG: tRNA (adenosine(37)-N6)-dimethylallyltransferase MiaA [Spirochaetae bacterium HGW-Spirochaetae-5]|nr:MAG: tRNA (adenosine(37)-N6)-dimethylallyltransferase MiaA [Spirochaetae bacterium HGW-Spirochaetae-5]